MASPSIFIYLSISVNLSIYPFLSQLSNLSISIYIYLSLSISIYLSLSIYIYPCLSLPIYICHYVPISLCICQFRSIPLSLPKHVYFYLVGLYLSLSVPISISVNFHFQLSPFIIYWSWFRVLFFGGVGYIYQFLSLSIYLCKFLRKFI